MVSPWQKKTASHCWRFFGVGFGSSLAGPFRQQAGEIKETEKRELREEPVRHRGH
jgi:hypothetical protein